MPTDVIMPALEIAQETGRIVRWLKSEGDAVVKGDPLMEIETDKVSVEIEAPADGMLFALAAAEGEDVPVGETVALILAPGEEAPGRAPVTAAKTPAVALATAVSAREPSASSAEPRRRRHPASPKARRIARKSGIDLAGIAGSGPHGAVVAADLDAAMPASDPRPRPVELLEVSPIWGRMAERVVKSWQATPHFFLLREVDASRLVSWRESLRSRRGEESVTHTDLLVKIAAEALRRHPRANASWADGHLTAGDGVNVAIAVAVEDGLVAPVVHDATRLPLDEIAARRTALLSAAREGRLRPEDVSGGTFTISNLGMFGVDAFLAILNAPQAAILAVGRIADRVAAVEGKAVVRPSLILTLSCDHRVLDGARAAEFLDTIATLIEEPAGMVA